MCVAFSVEGLHGVIAGRPVLGVHTEAPSPESEETDGLASTVEL